MILGMGLVELVMILAVLAVATLLVVIAFRVARRKGRDSWLWAIATLLFPLSLLLLLMLPKREVQG